MRKEFLYTSNGMTFVFESFSDFFKFLLGKVIGKLIVWAFCAIAIFVALCVMGVF